MLQHFCTNYLKRSEIESFLKFETLGWCLFVSLGGGLVSAHVLRIDDKCKAFAMSSSKWWDKDHYFTNTTKL